MAEPSLELAEPSPRPPSRRLTAAAVLVGACVLWGLSFPLTKAATMIQGRVEPVASTWFLTAWVLGLRYALSALVMAVALRGTLRGLTRSELVNGLGLAAFTAAGMALQTDGLSYTAASTSAFLTQCYCVLVPLAVALRRRRWPAWPVLAGCALVMAGVAVLSGIDWRELRLGRGEAETVLASLFFTAQILWIERPGFAGGHVGRVTFMLFASLAALFIPVALLAAPSASHLTLSQAPDTLASCIGLLVLISVGSSLAMNRWQQHVGAVEAGLIYGSEPLFTTLFVGFVPGWIAAASGIAFANERFTASLLVGGALIVAANVLIQLMRPKSLSR